MKYSLCIQYQQPFDLVLIFHDTTAVDSSFQHSLHAHSTAEEVLSFIRNTQIMAVFVESK